MAKLDIPVVVQVDLSNTVFEALFRRKFELACDRAWFTMRPKPEPSRLRRLIDGLLWK